MKVTVSGKPDRFASVKVPSSKSISHRALIAAALADEPSVIFDLAENDDTLATIQTLETLGAKVIKHDNCHTVYPIDKKHGYSGESIFCRQSASTMRFIIPLLAVLSDKCCVSGEASLMNRPQSIYEDLFKDFRREDECWKYSGGLQGGNYRIAGNISSQFITGLLFALPLLPADSILEITEDFESEPYVDMTIQVLSVAGIEIEKKGSVISVRGNQQYKSFQLTVPGDESQAAFFIALAGINQSTVEIRGLNDSIIQGDAVIRRFAENAGMKITENHDGITVKGEDLKAINADLKNCPDLGPVLFALATQCDGISCFTGIRRLRIKESDRIAAMQKELDKMNCPAEADSDSITITGNRKIRCSEILSGHNDHRIVMALAILATCNDHPVTIDGAEAVNKSYPDFFRDLANTGVTVTYE